MDWMNALYIVAAVVTIFLFLVWLRQKRREHKLGDPVKIATETKREIQELRREMQEHLDGLPQARPEIKDPFTEGMAHKERYEYDEAVRLFRQALAEGPTGSQRAALLLDGAVEAADCVQVRVVTHSHHHRQLPGRPTTASCL